MKPNSEIYYSCGVVPLAAKKYIQEAMDNSPRGRDGEFCSAYMQKKLEEFPWKDRGLQPPSLADFCLYGRALCKKGFGKNKRKSKRLKLNVQEVWKNKIISEAEAITGKIQDSFTNSAKFWALYDKINLEYPIPIPIFNEILISKRKRTYSKASGVVIYSYFPQPLAYPNSIKFGHTKENPHKRMESATTNTRSENPKLIGWFYGTIEDERRIKNHFDHFRIKDVGNKEMFKFPDINVAINFFQSEVEKNGGKIEIT